MDVGVTIKGCRDDQVAPLLKLSSHLPDSFPPTQYPNVSLRCKLQVHPEKDWILALIAFAIAPTALH